MNNRPPPPRIEGEAGNHYVVQFSKDCQSIAGTQRGRVFPLDSRPTGPGGGAGHAV